MHNQPILDIARSVAIVKLTYFSRSAFNSHLLRMWFPIACFNHSKSTLRYGGSKLGGRDDRGKCAS